MALALVPEHVRPLEKTHDRKAFDCGNEDLNRYLREQARQDTKKRVAASFVFTQPGSPAVLGFYTLSASIIPVEALPLPLLLRPPNTKGNCLPMPARSSAWLACPTDCTDTERA